MDIYMPDLRSVRLCYHTTVLFEFIARFSNHYEDDLYNKIKYNPNNPNHVKKSEYIDNMFVCMQLFNFINARKL